MQEYAQKPEKSSSDSNSRSSGQPPISEILQAYKNRTLQRISVDEEELLQAKTRDKSSERETLQRYTDYTHRDKSRYNSLIQGMFDIPQRKGIEDEEPLQGKFESSSTASESTVQREVKPNNTGLPDNLKSGIENLSGYSLDDVKVHYNSDKPAQLSALAYAQGTDIHVAPGQERHLPHEAWHVVQQKQGRVQPTMQMQGVDVNDNEGLEREADMMGGKTVQMEKSGYLDYEVVPIPHKTIQCVTKEEIEEAYDGWDNSKEGIDWKTVTQDDLGRYQTAAIEYGIKPMLKDVLGLEMISEDLDNKIKAVNGKMKVIDEEEFKVRNMCNAYKDDLSLNFKQVAEMDIADLREKAISFLRDNGEYKESFFDNFNDQGVRIGDYVFANRSKASKDLGIHLIIHECMHSIANSAFVESLGTGSLQDEGINEFFSRLATLKLREYLNSEENPYIEYLGAPGKSDVPESDGNGIYGKRMKGTDFNNLKEKSGLQDSIAKNMRELSVEELKTIGEKYFLGISV